MYFVNDNGLVKLNNVIYEPHHQNICFLGVRGHTKKLVNILKLPFQEEAILYEPRHVITCLIAYANNKGADQTAHQRLCCSLLDSIIYLLPTFFSYTDFFFQGSALA